MCNKVTGRYVTMHSIRQHISGLCKSFFLLAAMIALTGVSTTQSHAADESVVVYYSRTGKGGVVAKTIAGRINADIIQINDARERSGTWGFIMAAYDSQMENYTQIEPANVDFSKYKNIYFVSPIWNWKLSVPMRTLLHSADLQGKNMVMVTTANIDIKKYEGFGDDAPFIKRYLRDYLRDNRKGMMKLAKQTNADIVHHFHIATEGLSGDQIAAVTTGKMTRSLAATTCAAIGGH